MNRRKKCALFILLGQSNAVGHGAPMQEQDKVIAPMKNVFGLSREKNQSLENTALVWEGYTTAGMNLAEACDHSYSVANCLAKQWQAEIDGGAPLGDLYIVHIAIGAQGVSRRYMWHPDRAPVLLPGVLGKVDISLYPFTAHILSLVRESFKERGEEYEVIGLHWRGGENDTVPEMEELEQELFDIYTRIFDGFEKEIGEYPLILHKIVCPDRCLDMDATGAKLQRMHYINGIFERLSSRYGGKIFDATNAPQYIEGIRGNGIFLGDCVHYTPEVNAWVAAEILADYKRGRGI